MREGFSGSPARGDQPLHWRRMPIGDCRLSIEKAAPALECGGLPPLCLRRACSLALQLKSASSGGQQAGLAESGSKPPLCLRRACSLALQLKSASSGGQQAGLAESGSKPPLCPRRACSHPD
jgi:hypothetical protein